MCNSILFTAQCDCSKTRAASNCWLIWKVFQTRNVYLLPQIFSKLLRFLLAEILIPTFSVSIPVHSQEHFALLFVNFVSVLKMKKTNKHDILFSRFADDQVVIAQHEHDIVCLMRKLLDQWRSMVCKLGCRIPTTFFLPMFIIVYYHKNVLL